MPRLIKPGALLDNPWLTIARETTPEALAGIEASHLILPLDLWLNHRPEGKTVAVWLDSDETPEAIASELGQLPLVALNFPGFMDGRAYTSATTLRQRHGYQGEIRAIGDVLRDQLYYMKRCGFDTFELADGVDEQEALAAFGDFATSYTSTIEEPQPLFRRRPA